MMGSSLQVIYFIFLATTLAIGQLVGLGVTFYLLWFICSCNSSCGVLLFENPQNKIFYPYKKKKEAKRCNNLMDSHK